MEARTQDQSHTWSCSDAPIGWSHEDPSVSVFMGDFGGKPREEPISNPSELRSQW